MSKIFFLFFFVKNNSSIIVLKENSNIEYNQQNPNNLPVQKPPRNYLHEVIFYCVIVIILYYLRKNKNNEEKEVHSDYILNKDKNKEILDSFNEILKTIEIKKQEENKKEDSIKNLTTEKIQDSNKILEKIKISEKLETTVMEVFFKFFKENNFYIKTNSPIGFNEIKTIDGNSLNLRGFKTFLTMPDYIEKIPFKEFDPDFTYINNVKCFEQKAIALKNVNFIIKNLNLALQQLEKIEKEKSYSLHFKNEIMKLLTKWEIYKEALEKKIYIVCYNSPQSCSFIHGK
jgi:hypothetical protein